MQASDQDQSRVVFYIAGVRKSATHSVVGSGITSAAPNLAFATEHRRGRVPSVIPPSLSPTSWQTIVEASAQSASNGSSGVAIVTIAFPELGTTKYTAKSRRAARN